VMLVLDEVVSVALLQSNTKGGKHENDRCLRFAASFVAKVRGAHGLREERRELCHFIVLPLPRSSSGDRKCLRMSSGLGRVKDQEHTCAPWVSNKVRL
uniref:Uncharacterized protein n=1 Tax=Scleropages formosus TaxID=113540 RepID=A0A8C9SGZ6_SCLFO